MTDILEKIEKNTSILIELERHLSRIENAVIGGTRDGTALPRRIRPYRRVAGDRDATTVRRPAGRPPARRAGGSNQGAERGKSEGQVKSAERQKEAREEKSRKEESKKNSALSDALGKIVSRFGPGIAGNIIGGHDGDAGDAVGLTAGPIWSAIKEITDAIDTGKDSKIVTSVAGMWRKKKEETPSGRDANGRFIRKSRRDPVAESVDAVRETIEENEEREDRRHRRLIREIDDIPGGGGGDGGPSLLEGAGLWQILKSGGVGKAIKAAGAMALGAIPGGKYIGKAFGKVSGAAGGITSGIVGKLGAVAAKGGVVGKIAGVAGKGLGVGSRAMGALAAPLTGLLSFFEKRGELSSRKDLTAEQKTVQAASTGIGAGGGALAGASGGAALGATLGSAFPVVGTAIGGVIGAIAGGIAGAWGGEKIGEKVGEAVSGTMDKAEDEAARILEERSSKLEKKTARLLDDREKIISREGRRVWYKPTTWLGGKKGGMDYKPDPSIVTGNNLGRVSEKYESGGRGVGTISTGKGDAGGVSYGTYQLASKTGTMRSFLNSKEAEPYAGRFEGLEPGTPEFNKAYKEVVKSDPEGFSEAQHAYIKRTHFDPVAAYAKAKGMDVNDPAIQEALWSQSVQHSGKGNRKIIDSAVAKGGETNEDTINALYDARGDYAGQYASASATHNRYARERQDVLAIASNKDKKESLQVAAVDDKMASRAGSIQPVEEIRKQQPQPRPEPRGERRIEPVKRGDAGKTDTQIPTDYDDTLLTLMSIDRI